MGQSLRSGTWSGPMRSSKMEREIPHLCMRTPKVRKSVHGNLSKKSCGSGLDKVEGCGTLTLAAAARCGCMCIPLLGSGRTVYLKSQERRRNGEARSLRGPVLGAGIVGAKMRALEGCARDL